MFINHDYIENLLKEAENATNEDIEKVLDKACSNEKLSHKDIAILLQIKDKKLLSKMFKIAGDIKNLYTAIELFYLLLYILVTIALIIVYIVVIKTVIALKEES